MARLDVTGGAVGHNLCRDADRSEMPDFMSCHVMSILDSLRYIYMSVELYVYRLLYRWEYNKYLTSRPQPCS